jgi:hypothetical protein
MWLFSEEFNNAGVYHRINNLLPINQTSIPVACADTIKFSLVATRATQLISTNKSKAHSDTYIGAAYTPWKLMLLYLYLCLSECDDEVELIRAHSTQAYMCVFTHVGAIPVKQCVIVYIHTYMVKLMQGLYWNCFQSRLRSEGLIY